jgi:hypothetical protein
MRLQFSQKCQTPTISRGRPGSLAVGFWEDIPEGFVGIADIEI